MSIVKKTWLIVAFTALSILSHSAEAQMTDTQVNDTITVTGYGEVSAEPDEVTVSVSVSATDRDVNTAKAEADRRYKSVLNAAKSQGVSEKDIKLSRLNLSPEYQWSNNSQKLIGTRVSRTLSIKVRDISSVAPLLQDLVEGGVSTIDHIQTGFSNQRELERKALRAAIEDAKDKAEFLALQFGKELGSAHTINENQISRPSPRPYQEGFARAKSMAADLPQEQFGTEKINARIHVVFHAN